ncbi:hypothetical protein IWZ03DRAFT_33283 [Phyllosticta citriasiana]|uniref:Uncharacterized protein n=1 Tax=Phyllosticta citriasiana TaxID=595635 RepID=A0ABR1L112_9PEZI
MVWAGRTDSEMGHLGLAGPQIPWYKLRGLVEPLAGGRYLHIFDCFATLAATAFDQGAELLGASGVHHRLDDESSADSMDNGFTNVLARRLDQLDGKPRSVCHMYCDLMRSRTENGLQRTPVHLLGENTDSIVLGQTFQADNGMAFDPHKRRTGKGHSGHERIQPKSPHLC